MAKLSRPAPQNAHSGFSASNPRHLGMDYGWASGDAVTAALGGTVVSVYTGNGYNGGWGNLVIIDHGAGVHTAYAHFAPGTVTVSRGQRVETGHRLGTMGTTGKVTGKHLHFELRLGGAGEAHRTDPAPYFTRDLPGLGASPASGGARVSRQVRANVGTEGYLNGRTAPNLSGNVVQRLASNVVGEFDGFIRGARVTVDGVTSDIWFRGAYRGNYFAAAGFTSQDTSGMADLGGTSAPAPVDERLFAFLPEAWFVFPSAHAAVNAPRGHRGPTVGPGEFYVHEISGGAFRVDAGWLHPKAAPHVRRR